MSEKIKVGNAEVEKANYDYFLLMYEKMPKEYVVADLVSKCEDYDKLYKNYEMKNLQIEEIRKELINQDKYIGKLKEAYVNQLQQKENIIKEVREYCNLHLKTAKEVIIESEKWLEVEEQADFAKKDIHTAKVVKRNLGDILEILDKEKE